VASTATSSCSRRRRAATAPTTASSRAAASAIFRTSWTPSRTTRSATASRRRRGRSAATRSWKPGRSATAATTTTSARTSAATRGCSATRTGRTTPRLKGVRGAAAPSAGNVFGEGVDQQIDLFVTQPQPRALLQRRHLPLRPSLRPRGLQDGVRLLDVLQVQRPVGGVSRPAAQARQDALQQRDSAVHQGRVQRLHLSRVEPAGLLHHHAGPPQHRQEEAVRAGVSERD
jgi:hypothetical protein